MVAAAYARIASDLRGKITSRDIKPGWHLPSELQLRGQYGASRNTVLDAIKMLKDEGLVETRPGQGWFATVRIVPFVNSIGWKDSTAITQAQARGRKPQATPPVVSRRRAPPEMAERLSVPAGTEMVVRHHRRPPEPVRELAAYAARGRHAVTPSRIRQTQRMSARS